MSLQAVTGALAATPQYNNQPKANAEAFDAEKLASGKSKLADTEAVKSTNSSPIKAESKFLEKFIDQVRGKTAPTETAMQERLNGILKKGNSIRHHPLPSEVKTYIKDVRDFLTDVNEHAYAGNQRDGLFQKIDVVHSKLDSMAEDLMAGQQDEIALVNSLGQLQGLLVDLYV